MCNSQLHIRSRLSGDLSPEDIVKEMEPQPFKLLVANGDFEDPTQTILLHFEIEDWNVKETFIVAYRLTGPKLDLTFLKSTVLY